MNDLLASANTDEIHALLDAGQIAPEKANEMLSAKTDAKNRVKYCMDAIDEIEKKIAEFESQIKELKNRLGVPWWKVFFGTVLFWILSFCGGIFLFLINLLSPGQYHPGDFGYSILQFFSTAFGVVLAIVIYIKITEEKSSVGLLVNCIVGIIIFLLFTLFSGTLFDILSMLTAVAVFVICAVNEGRNLSAKSREEKG